MASLKPNFTLTSFTDTKDDSLPVVTHDLNVENVIVTTGKRHIATWHVKSSQLQASWSLRSGQAVTAGAVTDWENNGYAALVNQQALHMWGPENKSVEKSKKIKLQDPVHGLYSVAEQDVVIVYADGRVSRLSWSDSIHGDKMDQPIDFVDATEHQGHLVVVVCTGTNIRIYTWTPKDAVPLVSTVAVKTCKPFVCHCLHKKQDQLYLLQLESSGQLWQTCLSGHFANDCSKLHVVPDALAQTSMVSLGGSYLAIAGISIADQGGIGIWDLQFGLIQAWQPLPESAPQPTQLLVVDSQLVLTTSSGVYVYPYKDQPSTLAAALGKFAASASQTQTSSSLTSILEELSNNTKTGTHKAFKKCFKQLLKDPNLKGEGALLVQQPLCQVWQRCLQEKSFWPREEMEELLKAKLVPQSLHMELFETFTAQKDYSLLHSSLSYLSDIPESALISALICFLSATDESLLEHFTKEMTDGEGDEVTIEAKSPFSKEKAAFINKVLVQPFNDVFLLQCLRRLHIDQALVLLDHLQFLLHQVPLTTCDAGPSLIKVVDWLNLLLDAHFSQLVLTAEARQALLHLHTTVENQVKLYDELVSLEAVLTQLKSRCVLPQKQSPGLYNIHVLHVH